MSDFNACGLKECPYQIPYDMADHERIIREHAISECIGRIKALHDMYDVMAGDWSCCYQIVKELEQMKEQKYD